AARPRHADPTGVPTTCRGAVVSARARRRAAPARLPRADLPPPPATLALLPRHDRYRRLGVPDPAGRPGDPLHRDRRVHPVGELGGDPGRVAVCDVAPRLAAGTRRAGGVAAVALVRAGLPAATA